MRERKQEIHLKGVSTFKKKRKGRAENTKMPIGRRSKMPPEKGMARERCLQRNRWCGMLCSFLLGVMEFSRLWASVRNRVKINQFQKDNYFNCCLKM